ncbi:hypothetical protein GA830_00555 [Mesorhizobium sp. NBSH29]|uniref:flagellar hook-length control protein FliK n=1 Tax=Mesorhizobium sp. NBSH29 TaxID=2654249 RepID=UPI00189686CB|nr:flagellar hook-length control protein FliK [Mesorhizobium sp. NBSH29]QPC85400.1 hypothetical protein GA830_00555 [Mesorhizobium sp. NBSH29]
MTPLLAQAGLALTSVGGSNQRRGDDKGANVFGDLVKAGEKSAVATRRTTTKENADRQQLTGEAYLSNWDPQTAAEISSVDPAGAAEEVEHHPDPSMHSRPIRATDIDWRVPYSPQKRPEEIAVEDKGLALVATAPTREKLLPHPPGQAAARALPAKGDSAELAALSGKSEAVISPPAAPSLMRASEHHRTQVTAAMTAAPEKQRAAAAEKPAKMESRKGINAAPTASPTTTSGLAAAPLPGDRTTPIDSSHSPRIANQEKRQPDEDGQPATSKVTVVATQTLPAPAASSPATTTAAFLDMLTTDPSWKAQAHTASATPTTHAPSQPVALTKIKIQLTPVELGMVTAELRIAGDQLSVELTAETAEAHHRLSSDSETILKSLRALGYDIDKVSIQPLQPGSQAVRSDTATSSQRDLTSGFAGSSAGDREQSGARGNSSGGGNETKMGENSGASSRDRASRDLYI